MTAARCFQHYLRVRWNNASLGLENIGAVTSRYSYFIF